MKFTEVYFQHHNKMLTIILTAIINQVFSDLGVFTAEKSFKAAKRFLKKKNKKRD